MITKHTCAHCQKIIHDHALLHNPPKLLLKLGLDSIKYFHPTCYVDSRVALQNKEQRT